MARVGDIIVMGANLLLTVSLGLLEVQLVAFRWVFVR